MSRRLQDEEAQKTATDDKVITAKDYIGMIDQRKCLKGEFYSSLNGFNSDQERTIVLQVAYPNRKTLKAATAMLTPKR